nr:esterase [uncultured bacterium]
MRTSLLSATASLLLLSSGTAMAAEENMTFEVAGQKVVGTLETPDGVEKPPVVLMLHGFTGTRNELPVKDTDEGVFSRTARLLAAAGLASLRIDFRGSGESDGQWSDTTFASQIADAEAAVDWLKASDKVDGARIAILGWSQGGLVASHTASARPEVKAVSLWAPVVNPLYTFPALLGQDTVTKAWASASDTEITAKLPWGADTTLKAAFYQQLPIYSTPAALADYDGPLQVIVGLKDTLVTPQPASGEILLQYHDGPEELVPVETDHVFDAFVGPQVLDTRMVPATLAWLTAHL